MLLLPIACSPGDRNKDGSCEYCDIQDDVYVCYFYFLGDYFPVEGPAGPIEVCADSYENAIMACEDEANSYDPPLYYNDAMDAQLDGCHPVP
jgi:hypothetical protein